MDPVQMQIKHMENRLNFSITFTKRNKSNHVRGSKRRGSVARNISKGHFTVARLVNGKGGVKGITPTVCK